MSNFTEKERTCKCGCGVNGMKDSFMTKMDAVREDYGYPIYVTSGYRCAEHDRAVGSSRLPGEGPHTLGRAMDIVVPKEDWHIILDLAQKHGILVWNDEFEGGGLGVGRSFLHLDDLPPIPGRCRPSIWRA